jgi:hypothetical protein
MLAMVADRIRNPPGAAVLDLCELLGVELSAERRAHLAALDLPGLEALRANLKATKAWPAA